MGPENDHTEKKEERIMPSLRNNENNESGVSENEREVKKDGTRG